MADESPAVFTMVPLAPGPQALPRSKVALRAAYGVSKSTFKRWLHGLMAELIKVGYKPCQHKLTPKQVKVIFAHFDPPDGY